MGWMLGARTTTLLVEGKRDLVVRSGRISDGVMPYTVNQSTPE